jgi:D-alanyl-D-alanine dipeptidase
MRSIRFLVCAVLLAGGFAFSAVRARIAGEDALAHSTQMIVVTTSNWDAVEGRLQRFERASTHAAWRQAGEPIAIVVGKNGLGWGIGLAGADASVRVAQEPVKREGDGKSPAGIFDLGTAFGYAQQPLPGLKLPYLTLTPSIECVDDTSSKYYNRIVDRSNITPDWNQGKRISKHLQ